MKKLIKIKQNSGMSYIELIVVLSIFAIISSVVIFNYGDFQAKVDIKNLASDIALKIVEAQKSSLSGLLPTQATVSPWKPSYGVYFNSATPKQFIYFVDLNNLNGYEAGEMLDTVSITKNNNISHLNVFYQGGSIQSLNDLTITFSRPNSGAIIKSSTAFTSPVSFVQIAVVSPGGATAVIKLYPSGRVQVN